METCFADCTSVHISPPSHFLASNLLKEIEKFISNHHHHHTSRHLKGCSHLVRSPIPHDTRFRLNIFLVVLLFSQFLSSFFLALCRPFLCSSFIVKSHCYNCLVKTWFILQQEHYLYLLDGKLNLSHFSGSVQYGALLDQFWIRPAFVGSHYFFGSFTC